MLPRKKRTKAREHRVLTIKTGGADATVAMRQEICEVNTILMVCTSRVANTATTSPIAPKQPAAVGRYITSDSGVQPVRTTSPAGQPLPTRSSTAKTQLSSDSGLSTGAKAGISAGITVGAFIFLVVTFVFWRRRKQVGLFCSQNLN